VASKPNPKYVQNLTSGLKASTIDNQRLHTCSSQAETSETEIFNLHGNQRQTKDLKMDETEPKKMVSRNVAFALGIICVILIGSLAGAIAYYTTVVNGKDNTISSLDSQLSNVNGNFSNYELLKDFTVIANNQTVVPFANFTGGYAGYEFQFQALYSGYVSVTVNDSTENPTTARLIYFNIDYSLENDVEIPINRTYNFPVTGTLSPDEAAPAFVEILFKNPVYADDSATVTIVYYY
jgi:hypothetical protein